MTLYGASHNQQWKCFLWSQNACLLGCSWTTLVPPLFHRMPRGSNVARANSPNPWCINIHIDHKSPLSGSSIDMPKARRRLIDPPQSRQWLLLNSRKRFFQYSTATSILTNLDTTTESCDSGNRPHRSVHWHPHRFPKDSRASLACYLLRIRLRPIEVEKDNGFVAFRMIEDDYQLTHI